MQLLARRFGVFCSGIFKHEFSCRVLYLLEWFDDCVCGHPDSRELH